MHAALRRMKCAPVSYTLIHPGADEVGSLGVFTSEQSAVKANELAGRDA